MYVGQKDESARGLALKEPRLVTDMKTSDYLLSAVTELSPGHYGSKERRAPNCQEGREKRE